MNKSKARASFYALVVGTSEYSNPNMKLIYPDRDAVAMSRALEIGASNLFTKDSTHVTLIHTNGELRPTKENIRKAFIDLQRRTQKKDVVLVYFSGHGLAYGIGEKDDFYYLTQEAVSNERESYRDAAIRKSQTISGEELKEWLSKISAKKRVLIMDACGSGKLVENITEKKDIDPQQERALDRLRDRQGLYLISGCTSDQSSYESSRYGQGILTYTLLEAIKGAALGDGTLVDVGKIFSYAVEKVPERAKGIGGIQQPMVRQPQNGSIDIGLLKSGDKEKIPLARYGP
jgi:uncharacterized caspase-like protein